MKRYTSIRQKVAFILLVSLVLGVGFVVFYFAYSQNSTLYFSTQNNLFQQADVLHESIKNAMLPGEAPLVVSLFNDIQQAGPGYWINLYRRNGQVAFSDDSTIDAVNARLEMPRFMPKNVMLKGSAVDPDEPNFAAPVKTGETTSYHHRQGEKSYLTIYKPLLNLPKCTGCHGSDHTIRGVISIQTDMTPIFTEARNNIVFAVLFFIVVVLVLFLILSLFLKRTVISPIQRVGFVADQVTKGNFQEKVAINSHDEIGELGRKINTMVDGLYERFALSKYVSSSTIESIRNSEKGAKKEIALFFSDIRGFTSFSERLEPEAIVESLNKILNVQTEIIHRHGGDIDKYVGDEIVALFTGPGKERNACLAALEIQTYILLYHDDLARLNVGIGINTGEVVLGRIGSERRADFTVIGDHVNFASRLCSQAKAGEVIISASTYQKIQHQAEVSKPQEIKVKGKEKPQKVYLLTTLGKKSPVRSTGSAK